MDQKNGSLYHFLVRRLDTLRDHHVLSNGWVRRGLLAAFYSVVITMSLQVALWLRFDFIVPQQYQVSLLRTALGALIVKNAVFALVGLYSGIWRYTDLPDIKRILLGNICATLALSLVLLPFWPVFLYFPRSCLVMDCLLCFMAITVIRVGSRAVREIAIRNVDLNGARTVLFGSIDNVDTIVSALKATGTGRRFLGIFSPNAVPGRILKGIPVWGSQDGPDTVRMLAESNPDEIIIVLPHAGPAALRGIMALCERAAIRPVLKTIPLLEDLLDGAVTVKLLKEVEIEDLLGRTPSTFDRSEVKKQIEGRTILVTGGGGSIGSELCRQIARYAPARLLILELSEYNLYEIERKLAGSHPDLDMIPIIGNVQDLHDLDRLLGDHSVDVVYHAAAYKHVPMMEVNVKAALLNNVIGTGRLADTCCRYGVKRVVMVSTDKAVRPANVMGASKLMAEQVILSRPRTETEFVVVRFGNVLGSSGSVVPLFREQIASGGPITVTTPDATRYFMTIPEAADLVLQAGAIGDDRDIMVLDMGAPVRVVDLARRMVELSGLVPDDDIQISFVGLRPGEKEYEELLADRENVVRTPYDRILVVRDNAIEADKGRQILSELTSVLTNSAGEQVCRDLIARHVSDCRLRGVDGRTTPLHAAPR